MSRDQIKDETQDEHQFGRGNNCFDTGKAPRGQGRLQEQVACCGVCCEEGFGEQ